MATRSPRRTPTNEQNSSQQLYYNNNQEQMIQLQDNQQPQYLQIRIKTPEPGWTMGNKSQYQEGENVHFEARVAPATENNLRVDWYHNGRPLVTGDRYRTAYDNSGHILLDILYVYPEDAGVYKCVATNEAGCASSEFEIQVISKSSPQQQLRSGSASTTNTMSQHNDTMLMVAGGNGAQVNSFTDVDVTCWNDANNSASNSRSVSATSAAATDLGPPQAPQFELKPVGCSAFEGSSARFYCRLIGNPRPNVVWFHNGHRIDASGARYKLSYDGMYHLTILDCRLSDAGNIEMQASNYLGQCRANTHLTINQKVDDYRNALRRSPNQNQPMQKQQQQSSNVQSGNPQWYALAIGYGDSGPGNNSNNVAVPEVNIHSPSSPVVQLAQSPAELTTRAPAPSTIGRAIKTREAIMSPVDNQQTTYTTRTTVEDTTISDFSSPYQDNQQVRYYDQPTTTPSGASSKIQYHPSGVQMMQQQQQAQNTPVINQGGQSRDQSSSRASSGQQSQPQAHTMQQQTPRQQQQPLSYSQQAIQNQQQYHHQPASQQQQQQQQEQLTRQKQYLQYMMNKEKTPEPSWTAHRVPDLDSVQSDPLYQDLMLELQRLEENVSASGLQANQQPISDSPLVPESRERPRFTQRIIPERVDLEEAESCEFMCRLEPSSDPNMKVDWFHNGEPLREGSRYTVEFDFGVARLVIRRCEGDDSGVYQCRAHNLLGEATSSGTLRVNAKASVQYETLNPTGLTKIRALENPIAQEEPVEQSLGVAPKFVTQIVDYVEKDEAQSLHLECQLAPVDDPDMKTEWFFNGRPLVTGSRFHTIDDFGFIVLDIDWLFPRDTGEYVCRATNKHGQDLTRCVLRVRPDKNIVLESQIDDPNLIEKLHQLEFPSVPEPEIVHEQGKPAHFVQHLMAQQNKTHYQEGENVHFEARVAPATDPNLTVEWFHNDQPLMSGHRFKPAFDFGHILLDILYVYPEDAGVYKCVASNGLGTPDTSQFEIQVQGKPGLDYRTQLPEDMVGGVQKLTDMEAMWNRAPDPEEEEPPQARQAPEFVLKPVPCTAFENSVARFCCRIIGHPRPRLTWAINGQAVFSGSRYKLTYDGMYHLTILKCQLTDAGKVEVYARNPLGDCLAITQLVVRPKVDDYRNVLKKSPNPWYDEQVLRQYRRQRLADANNNDFDLDELGSDFDPTSSVLSTPLAGASNANGPRLTLGLPPQSYVGVGYMEPGTPDVNLLAPGSPLLPPGPAHPAVARSKVTQAPAPSTIGRALRDRSAIKSPEKSYTIEDHGRPTHSALHVAIEGSPTPVLLRHPRDGTPDRQRFQFEYREPEPSDPATSALELEAYRQAQEAQQAKEQAKLQQQQPNQDKNSPRQHFGMQPRQAPQPAPIPSEDDQTRRREAAQQRAQVRAMAQQQAEEQAMTQQLVQEQAMAQQRAQEQAMAQKRAQEQAMAQHQTQEQAMAQKRAQEQAMAQKRAQEQAMAQKRAQEQAMAQKRAQEQAMVQQQARERKARAEQERQEALYAQQSQQYEREQMLIVEEQQRQSQQRDARSKAASEQSLGKPPAYKAAQEAQQQQRAGSEARQARGNTPGPEEGVSGREVHLHTNKQTLVERRNNKEIRRDIIEREIFEQEHKGAILFVEPRRSQTPQRQLGPESSPQRGSSVASDRGESFATRGQARAGKQVHFQDEVMQELDAEDLELAAAFENMVPPEFTQKIQPCQAIEGDEAVFECSFVGDPLPTISWFRESRPIKASNLYQIVTDEYKSKLSIKRVTLNSNAVFTVKAENDAGSAKSSANLVVEAHPRPETSRGGRAVQIDADHYVFNDEEFTDDAIGEGTTGGEITSTTTTVAQQQSSGGQAARVSRIDSQDSKQAGSDSKQVVLSVRTRKLSPDDLAAVIRRSPEGLVAPSFLHSIHDIVSRPGELVRLDARVLGSGPLEVRWLKDGARLRPDKLHKMLLEADLYTLLILECSPDDSGTYECVVANRVGEARCRAKLLVSSQLADSRSRTPEPFNMSAAGAASLARPSSAASSASSSYVGGGPNLVGTRSSESPAPGGASSSLADSIPKIIKRLESQSVREGAPVTLRCQISSFPVPPQVQWFKDGDKLIKPSRYFKIFKDNEETYCLRISEVFAEDAGEYKCVARALNGRSYVETRASINVL